MNTLGVGGLQAVHGPDLALAFSRGLGRTIRYLPLALDDFEAGVDRAIGPGVGEAVGAIFRFIERHPDDRAFVSAPLDLPTGFPAFEPTPVEQWVASRTEVFGPREPGRSRRRSIALHL